MKPKKKSDQVETPNSQTDVVPAPPTAEVVEEVVEKVIEEANDAEFITEEDLELLKQENVQSEVEEELFPEKVEFVKQIEPSERAHYENIIRANKEAIKSLRFQLQTAHAEIEALKLNEDKTKPE